ncbi:MAG TPA: 50S ribosomal protein L7/L12 [Candidatus Babeliales bacterium]|nr:50S ribosomal protein L7/L12 [Candidatus Babeliales bacterium]
MSAKSYEKFIDEIGNMSVIELADLVKALESKFGISAAMPMASAAAPVAEAAPVAAEKSEYKVTLKDAGTEKIKVIKALREVIPNLALSDAKKLTEEPSAVIAESVSKADAEKMKKKLEEVGAKVELA